MSGPQPPPQTGPGAPRLQIRGLCAGYRDRVVLRDVDLDVDAGERLGVIGPNGAGKSTLLACLVGLLRPRDGEIRVDGHPAGRVRGRIAYLPQRAEVDWEHPAQVRDVVAMGRYPHRGPIGRLRREDHLAVEDAVERVGMTPLARTRIAELSGGQQQRTLLARTLAQQASILLLDEPYVGLDAASTAIIDRELASAARAGAAVVVVNHDLAGVAGRYERLLVLNGRVIATDTPANALTPSVLEAAYGRGAGFLAAPEGPE